MTLHTREAEANLLQHRVPLCTKRFLHVECGPGVLCALVRQRCGAETAGICFGDASERAHARTQAGLLFDNVQAAIESGIAFDCIVVSSEALDDALLSPTLNALGNLLAPMGQIAVRHANDLSTVAPAGLVHYATWPADVAAGELEEEFIPAAGEYRIDVLVHRAYDPLQHAQQLAKQNHFDQAYEILCGVPPSRRSDAAIEMQTQLLKMVCLLGMQKLGAYPPITCLAAGWFLFARIQRRTPNRPEVFRVVARFWDAIGDEWMGARLRAIADELEGKLAPALPQKPAPPEQRVEFSGNVRHAQRVLFVMGDTRVDYGLDVLYHGLKLLLGGDNVTEYPWKPTLHGGTNEKFAHYPALFSHAGDDRDVLDLMAALRAGAFDLIVWGDVEMHLPQATARAIITAGKGLPLALVDMRDDCAIHLHVLKNWLGLETLPPYFKRELLRTAPDAALCTPFPFAYADEYIAVDIDNPRAAAPFWAGQRGWGLRDVFLPLLDARGVDTRRKLSQEDYRAALRGAQTCLNLAGAGFDTVRYWEAPAQGCLLLSETLPITIPHDFVDMEDALFFSTRRELEERLNYIAAHPQAAESMRRAGHAKLRVFHSATARARQLLSGMLLRD